MLNKLLAFIRQYDMVQPGDRIVCAVSGGADSVALLFAMYLLREKLQIELAAAHFNHGLRGEESDADEAFVCKLCQQYDIPLFSQKGTVAPGKKGLEAAARDARYGFLKSLPGKIATAHTANDNAETVLMHMVRGTGLKGLGGISPVNGKLIRPMLNVTRKEVLDFLNEYHLSYVTDSSNDTDQFLRNRLRHNVMPALEKENPCLMENISALALRLREDDVLLQALATQQDLSVSSLRQMPGALRSRAIAAYLENSGVPEPEAAHIRLVEKLIFSQKPSAKADLPGGVTLVRSYDQLEVLQQEVAIEPTKLPCPGAVVLEEIGLRIVCDAAPQEGDAVVPQGMVVVRSRQPGDTMRLRGGTKELKKLFIDRKIPAHKRAAVAVVADERGILAVQGFGINLDRAANGQQGVQIRFETI